MIADAISNTEDETKRRRKQRGEDYWNKNGFPMSIFNDEKKKLIDKGIKIHSYYLNPSGTSNFFK